MPEAIQHKPEVREQPPRPKLRRERPGYLLRPGSRAAFVRGCKCFTIGCFTADEREHQPHCPLRKTAEEGMESGALKKV